MVLVTGWPALSDPDWSAARKGKMENRDEIRVFKGDKKENGLQGNTESNMKNKNSITSDKKGFGRACSLVVFTKSVATLKWGNIIRLLHMNSAKICWASKYVYSSDAHYRYCLPIYSDSNKLPTLSTFSKNTDISYHFLDVLNHNCIGKYIFLLKDFF